MTEVYRLTENIYRIKHWKNSPEREPLLSKYRIIDLRPDGTEPELVSRSEEPTASVGREGLYRLAFTLDAGEHGGFEIRLPLDPAERLYGLGDESRTCIEKHGHLAGMRLENASSYGPVPYLMSSRGWAVLLNCTYAHVFDVAAS
jgi:hypothetical protein